jgi:hypothetical protein
MHDESLEPTPAQPAPGSDLSRLIRLPPLHDAAPAWPGAAEGSRLAARSASRRDEEEDEEDEDDEPRVRKKRARDDDDEDEEEEDEEDDKPAKKKAAPAKDKKKDAKKKDARKKPVEEEEERPRRVPKKGTKRYQMYVVNNGLGVVNGALMALFAVAGFASFHTFGYQLMQWQSGEFVSTVLLIILLCSMPLAFLVAESMLFVTPAKADARGSLMAAVSLHGICIFLGIVAFLAPTLVSDANLALRLREFTIGGANFAFWLGFLMLIGYIKQLYYYLSDQPGGNSASTLGLFFFIAIGLGYGLFYAGYTLLKSIEWLWIVLVPGWFIWDGWIGRSNVLIMRNLKTLREKIDRYIWPPDEE